MSNTQSRSAKIRYDVRNKNKFIFPNKLIVKFKRYLELDNLIV